MRILSLFRKYIPAFLTAIFLLIIFGGPLSASQFVSKRVFTVAETEQFDDDLYLFCSYGKVHGRVNGDLTAFCYDVNATGEVDGNANLFAFRADIRGKVDRSARVIANSANINGEIMGNLVAIASQMDLGEKGIVRRDLNAMGQSVTIEGRVEGNLRAEGKTVIITGTIEGDVYIEAEEISIAPPAVIKGNLKYVSPRDASIEKGAVIQGEKSWQLPETKKEESEKEVSVFSIMSRIGLFLMALLTGFIIILLFKRHTLESVARIEQNFPVTLAAGFVTALICSLGALIFLIMIIGIPIGIFLLCLGVILFYTGKIYVAIYLGRIIIRLVTKSTAPAIGWALLVGLIILTLLFQIPFLGTVIYIFTFILGMGGAIMGYLGLNKEKIPAPPIPPVPPAG